LKELVPPMMTESAAIGGTSGYFNQIRKMPKGVFVAPLQGKISLKHGCVCGVGFICCGASPRGLCKAPLNSGLCWKQFVMVLWVSQVESHFPLYLKHAELAAG